MQLRFLVAPQRVVTDERGRITGIELMRTTLGDFGLDGRRRPVSTGETRIAPCDNIILAIGENVPALKSDAEKKDFEDAVTGLLTNLKGDRAPVVLVRSSFWANAEKDAALRAACNTVGGTFVDIGLLGKDEANYARSERDFKHAGVANHPGDKGMAAIAAAIVNAIAPKNP